MKKDKVYKVIATAGKEKIQFVIQFYQYKERFGYTLKPNKATMAMLNAFDSWEVVKNANN